MILCASPRCRGRGHQPTCVDDGCRGCLPRPAADGRNLCELCTRWLGENAVQAAWVYAELEFRLGMAERMGEKTSGSRDRGLKVNVKVMEARTLIKHTLVSWSLMISEERGIALPRDLVGPLGQYVARHAEWLSAHPAAGDCADEMYELARGQAWRAAFPNPVFVADVGPCPIKDCTGRLTGAFRQGDALLPSTVECDAEQDLETSPHLWTSMDWRALRKLYDQKKEREMAA